MEPRKTLTSIFFLLMFCVRGSVIESRILRHLKHQKNSGAGGGLLKASSKRLPIHYVSSDPYDVAVGSPASSPPYEDFMGPSSPQDFPPFCVYPPLTPFPPSTTTPPSPVDFMQQPPPPFLVPNPPEYSVPSPPEYIQPSPPSYAPTPPKYDSGPPSFGLSPPAFVPNPSSSPPPPPVWSFVPSPPEFTPGTPVFLPPIVYPPPAVPSPPMTLRGLWCVAKPTVPDPIIQEAMNYACGSGADCDSIQPKGSCYQPDTLIAHASFAFNSYWQRTRVAGGTCDFGGTAMLVTKDPSYDGCRFTIN